MTNIEATKGKENNKENLFYLENLPTGPKIDNNLTKLGTSFNVGSTLKIIKDLINSNKSLINDIQTKKNELIEKSSKAFEEEYKEKLDEYNNLLEKVKK
ncbi:MAG: hypothetical protein ACP5RI_03855, partial [Candidatus Micrarchaeia archaeon]